MTRILHTLLLLAPLAPALGTAAAPDSAAPSAVTTQPAAAERALTALPGSGRLALLDGRATRWLEQLGGGRWVLLKVWASDCPVCNHSITSLVEFAAHRSDPRLRLLGVAIDGYSNRRGVDNFIRRHRVNFPTLIDDGHAVDALYRAGTGMDWGGFTPTFLLFDPDGALVAKRIGPLRAESVLRFIDQREAGGTGGDEPRED